MKSLGYIFFRKIGEHYRLLPLIINLINAKKVIEIGTFKGHHLNQ